MNSCALSQKGKTMSDANTDHWIDDACNIFDNHAKDFGWNSHIYSERLRALAAERDALRAALEKTWAVLDQIESHRRLCMQYDEENGHPPRTFDEEDLRIMEIAARTALKEIARVV